MRALLVTVASGLMAFGAATAAEASSAIPLNTGQEASQVTSGGSGFFSYTVDGNELCYTLSVHNLSASPVAAHIHIGQRGVAGPVVVPLVTPPAATSSVSQCLTAVAGGALTPDELAAITADPGQYYVNVHTPANPGGEVRGQLK
jgi:hypothetical protein